MACQKFALKEILTLTVFTVLFHWISESTVPYILFRQAPYRPFDFRQSGSCVCACVGSDGRGMNDVWRRKGRLKASDTKSVWANGCIR